MLDAIIRFSLNNRLAVLAMAVLVTIAGVWTAKTMEVDVFPDLNAPTVVVMTEARGMAPEEVERVVTFPIETALNGATGVRRVRSSSQTGFSCVWVEFDWDTEIYRDRQIVAEKLSEVSSSLPATVGTPTLGPQSSILGEVMIIGLTRTPLQPSPAGEGDLKSHLENPSSKTNNTAPSPAGEGWGGVPLRTFADWTLRPRLQSLGGVAQVSVHGGEVKEYQVLLHPERMRHHNVSVEEAVEAVRDMNQNVSGGVLYEYGNEYLIRGALATTDVEELGMTVVKTVDGVPVLLDQIADIRIGNQRPLTGCASNNAQPAVLLTVSKQPGVSTEELTRRIDEVLEHIDLPEGVHVDSQIFRQQRFIDASISNIKEALLEGALFVVIVLFLFLMNVRTTLISLITIPLSLLVSILTLRAFGLTINTMSIGGMAIAIGSLVDDAIVDVENVYKHLTLTPTLSLKGEGALKSQSPHSSSKTNEETPSPFRANEVLGEECPLALRAERGEQSVIATVGKAGVRMLIYQASREVRLPILNSTLIIVAAFLPLFFLSGMEGRMLVPLGVAFIVSLFASTVVALTLTPVLCSYLLTPAQPTSPQPSPQSGEGASKSQSGLSNSNTNSQNSLALQGERGPWGGVPFGTPCRERGAICDCDGGQGWGKGETRLVSCLKSGYARALSWCFGHRRTVLAVTGVAFAVAVVCFFTLGRSFLPPFNEGSYTISLSTLPGISLEESDKIGRTAEQLLMEIPEIQTVARKTGRAELDEHAFGVNTSEIEAPFVLKDRSRKELLADVRQRLSALPGVAIEIGQPISHRIDAMLSGTRANVAIKVFGTDLQQLYKTGQQIRREIEDIEGVTDLNVEQLVDRPQLRITPKRTLMAKYGVTPKQFADYVSVLLEGETVSQVYEGGGAFGLVVKVAEEDGNTMDKIRNLMIDANGTKIPLDYIAKVESTSGPNIINRENAQRKLVVSANIEGRDMRSVVDEIQERIRADVQLPEGYHVEYGGQFESEASASRILLLTSLVSLIIIFLLLMGQFHSWRQSAVVMASLPLALIGGVIAIVLTGGVLSIPAIIGFISLFGIATRNGILLIDKFNQGDELVEAAQDRLTPILMTALTSALALVPLALGGDLPGNEIQSPMAVVMLGGLVSSTLLNIFVIPLLYTPPQPSPQGEGEE